ncbi:MAG: hypothetical protein JWR59_134 [Brevundimonas sp.]|nr:hypothetical protein [Brevundimonas sp.]
MGMVDQVWKMAGTPLLSGKLLEIDAILARVSDPEDELTEDAALRAIANIVAPARSGDIYQKPLG